MSQCTRPYRRLPPVLQNHLMMMRVLMVMSTGEDDLRVQSTKAPAVCFTKPLSLTRMRMSMTMMMMMTMMVVMLVFRAPPYE